MIMETEKSRICHLQANWRPRKAGGVVLVQAQQLRIRGASGVSPNLSLKA